MLLLSLNLDVLNVSFHTHRTRGAKPPLSYQSTSPAVA
jgi:hypothetical protein